MLSSLWDLFCELWQDLRRILPRFLVHLIEAFPDLLVNFDIFSLKLPQYERDVQKATTLGQCVNQILLDLSVLVRCAIALDLAVVSGKLGV